MTSVSCSIGNVGVTRHGYDRIDRHSITVDYVDMVAGLVDSWGKSYDDIVGHAESNGIKWKIVLTESDNPKTDAEYKLVTIVPDVVFDVDEAKDCDLWSSADVLNLKLYSNKK